mgnify:CR=1 FL=1
MKTLSDHLNAEDPPGFQQQLATYAAMPFPVVVASRSGRILYSNPIAENLLFAGENKNAATMGKLLPLSWPPSAGRQKNAVQIM